MLTTLSTPYTDTRAGDLAWALGREPLPALAQRALQFDGVTVQLRLLGASHQVLLEEDGSVCSETVACMPGSSTPLPLGVSRHTGEWEYDFAAQVETLSPREFAARARELLDLVSDHPGGLAGTFPGAPHAFTALLVERLAGHVRWRTWHSYPQEGRLVSTRTRVARLPAQECRGRRTRGARRAPAAAFAGAERPTHAR
ncbi:DUF2617 family protein [Streptomyces winkii]|uniref:DUF2617 family protein n=1 Tax=Streptomyces winkii TaxID=3051178 RepID=UPI0028D2A067|nr:DUF2617 family protein [Streptomyces sp. DSM 40971]